MKTTDRARQEAYTIAEAARKTGYDAETLRYYEREGLLRGIARKGARRIYTDENLRAISLIACLKKTGMPPMAFSGLSIKSSVAVLGDFAAERMAAI